MVGGDDFASMWALPMLTNFIYYTETTNIVGGPCRTSLGHPKLQTDRRKVRGVEEATCCQRTREKTAMAVLQIDGIDSQFPVDQKYEIEPEPWEVPSLSVISNWAKEGSVSVSDGGKNLNYCFSPSERPLPKCGKGSLPGVAGCCEVCVHAPESPPADFFVSFFKLL